MKRLIAALFLVPAASLPAGALTPPDLASQKAWGEGDKKAFLEFLKSNQPMPAAGNVKEVTTPKGYEATTHKARYLGLSLLTDTVYTETSDGTLHRESTTLGPKVMVGGHLFTWLRYYGGVQYNSLKQNKLDGSQARLSHFQVPLGLEVALVPLGTPQTRYVLLRGGLAAHYVAGPDSDSDFKAPILGLRGTWNAALGYEWQVYNSDWRLNALVEGYRSISRQGGANFYGLGLTLGAAYTF